MSLTYDRTEIPLGPSPASSISKLTLPRQDNGTVAVNNTCQAQGQAINILGTAAPANPTYGAAGVFQVGFPGQAGPSCPGPNYIVQGELGFRLEKSFVDRIAWLTFRHFDRRLHG